MGIMLLILLLAFQRSVAPQNTSPDTPVDQSKENEDVSLKNSKIFYLNGNLATPTDVDVTTGNQRTSPETATGEFVPLYKKEVTIEIEDIPNKDDLKNNVGKSGRPEDFDVHMNEYPYTANEERPHNKLNDIEHVKNVLDQLIMNDALNEVHHTPEPYENSYPNPWSGNARKSINRHYPHGFHLPGGPSHFSFLTPNVQPQIFPLIHPSLQQPLPRLYHVYSHYPVGQVNCQPCG